MAQYGFYFNGLRCTGCKTCVLTCKDYKDLSTEVALRNVIDYAGGTWTADDSGAWTTDAFAYFISIACNHCDNPACVEICPQGAMMKDEETGLVYNDPELCIACGSCVTACPYEAPIIDPETNLLMKCDGCKDRVAEGLKPICVESCPLRALDFAEISELRDTYGDVAEIAPLPPASTTAPNFTMTEPANAKPIDDTSGEVNNPNEIV